MSNETTFDRGQESAPPVLPNLGEEGTFDEPVCRIVPVDEPDWGYARSKRCALMVASGEWSQGVYSRVSQIHGKCLVTPDRDSPYEGLHAHTGGENWKYVDSIPLGLIAEGQCVAFELDPSQLPAAVEALAAVIADGQQA